MGFFKFLNKKKQNEPALDEVPLPTPPAPAVDNISNDLMSSVPGDQDSIQDQTSMMPEPPKPFDYGSESAHDLPNQNSSFPGTVAPPAPAPIEMQKPIMPTLPEHESIVPPAPSFADQFGTHPKPIVEKNIQTSSNPNSEFKVPDLNINNHNIGDHNINDQKLELEKHFDKISSDLNKNSTPIPLTNSNPQEVIDSTIPKMTIKPENHAQVDTKIEEHLDDIFSFGSSFIQKKDNPSVKVVKKEVKELPTNIESKSEDHFENFIKNNLNKNQESDLNNNKSENEYHGPSHLNLEKPLFLSLDTCEKLSDNLNDVRVLLKEKEIAFHALNDIDKTLESHYTHWKGIMESVQTQLFTIDKKLFR